MKVCLDWVKDYVRVKDKPAKVVDRLTMCGLEAHLSVDSLGTGLTAFDTEVTSNRPDWLSHIGVAREIAAVYGTKLKLPPLRLGKKQPLSDAKIGVRIEDQKRCPYYSCVVLEGVKDQPSPKFIQDRLRACGLRPVSLVVDVTNFVLLEMGQPLHAFDLDSLGGDEIIVRTARANEKIKAIDGKVYPLILSDLVIADQRHPIALAGVMGGIESEFGQHTKRVLLESAYFQPRTVRLTSRRLALASDSSYRFERGVDPALVDQARDRAVYLIATHGSLEKVSRVYKSGRLNIPAKKVSLDMSEMEKILGLFIPAANVKKILTNLGLSVRPKKKNVIEVTVPSSRPDLTRSIDLVEEVTRIYGYDRLPETIPSGILPASSEAKALEVEEEVREVLTGAGYHEAVSFSLENEELLERLGLLTENVTTVVNPQNKALTIMRPSLLPGLLRAFALNADHGHETIRLFEIAHAYGAEKGKALPTEDVYAAILLAGKADTGWGSSGRKSNFFDLKGAVEILFKALRISDFQFTSYVHKLLVPGEALGISVSGEPIGFLGTLGGDAQAVFGYKETGWVCELNLTRLTAYCGKLVKYSPPSRFPSAKRDVALIVKEDISSRDILEFVSGLGSDLVRNVEVFDVFQGGSIPKGSKSMAFSIEYGLDERTLTSEEVNDLHKKIGSGISEKFHAQIR